MSVFSGLAGTLGLSASLIFREPKYTYPAAFFTWFVLIILNNSMMNVFQPFTEYGFHPVVSAEIRYLIILILIPFFSYFYWIKKDEL